MSGTLQKIKRQTLCEGPYKRDKDRDSVRDPTKETKTETVCVRDPTKDKKTDSVCEGPYKRDKDRDRQCV